MTDLQVDTEVLRDAGQHLATVAAALDDTIPVGSLDALGAPDLTAAVSSFLDGYTRETDDLAESMRLLSSDLSGGAEQLRDADLAIARAVAAAQQPADTTADDTVWA